MKRIAGVVLVIAMLAGLVYAEEEAGPAVSVSLDAASAYVFRGVTLNDGLVLQPGAEIGLAGVTAGVWGNYDIDDYDGALEKNTLTEIDYYLSYAVPVGCAELSAGGSVYTYHNSTSDDDYEIFAGVGLDVCLSPSLTVYYGLDGAIEKSMYIEAGIGREFAVTDDVTVETGAVLGYVNPDAGDSGFSHANFTVGASYKYLSASVTYVAQIDDDVLPDAAFGYDTEVYGMLGVAYEF